MLLAIWSLILEQVVAVAHVRSLPFLHIQASLQVGRGWRQRSRGASAGNGSKVLGRWFRRAAARSDCSSGVGFSFLVCSVEWHLQAVLPGAYLSPTSTTAAPSVVAPVTVHNRLSPK